MDLTTGKRRVFDYCNGNPDCIVFYDTFYFSSNSKALYLVESDLHNQYINRLDIQTLSFSSDESAEIITCSDDLHNRKISLYQGAKDAPGLTSYLEAHPYRAVSGKKAAFVHDDLETVKIFDTNTGTLQSTFQLNADSLKAVSLSGNGTILAAGFTAKDSSIPDPADIYNKHTPVNAVLLYDTAKGSLLKILNDVGKPVSLFFRNNNLLICTIDGRVHLYDTENETLTSYDLVRDRNTPLLVR